MTACLRRLMVEGPAVIAFVAVVAAGTVPARANAPTGRYTVADGIVTDAMTKLRWQQTTGTYNKATPAASTCAALDLGGAGWRLPTMKELQTIVDESRTNPAIDPIFTTPTPTSLFASSSPVVGLTNGVWAVSFKDGTTMYGTAETGVVRCVR